MEVLEAMSRNSMSACVAKATHVLLFGEASCDLWDGYDA